MSETGRVRSNRWLTAALVLALTFATACGGAETAEQQRETSGANAADAEAGTSLAGEQAETVSLRVAPTSPAPVLWAYLWIAEPLGYYDEEKLEVEIVSNLPAGAVETALQLGDLDFGGSSQQRLIPLTAEEGESVAQIFFTEANYLFSIVVLEDSPVQSAQDLVGGVIGVPEAGGDEDTTAVLMATEGVTRDEYETLATGGRAAGGVALERGEVDAVMGSFADTAAMENAGINVRAVPTGQTSQFYNSGVAASPDTIENRRDVAVRFGRAAAKASIWMFENPDATVDLLGEVAPEAVQDREQALELLEAGNANNQSLYESRFATDPDVWQDMIEWFHDNEAIDEPFAADQIMTNELIDEIWDFDVASVQEAARDDDRSAS